MVASSDTDSGRLNATPSAIISSQWARKVSSAASPKTRNFSSVFSRFM